MGIYLVGLNHRTAPLGIRESFAVAPEELQSVLDAARKRLGASEACVISTCNRVELLLAIDEPPGEGDDPQKALRELFAARRPDVSIAPDVMYVLSGRPALEHVFRVAASLDSMIVGETQIAGQVRSALHVARERGSLGPRLQAILEGALRASRRVHAETAIGEGQVSVASVAVEFATKVFQSFEDKTALIIGSGETARLVVQHVREKGLRRFYVVNRSFERACSLAETVQGTATPFEGLADVLARADVIVSTTASPDTVLSVEMVRAAMRERRGQPVIVLDLAVPRDVDPAAAEEEGVFLYDLDDLEGIATENRERRSGETELAVRIVEKELEGFALREEISQELGPVVAAVRGKADAIVATETKRLFGRMKDLDEKQREEIERMAARVVNKLLHAPVSGIKEEARNGSFRERLAWFSSLFGVGGRAAPSSDPDDEAPGQSS